MKRVFVIQNFIIIACQNKYLPARNKVEKHISHIYFTTVPVLLTGLLLSVMVSCTGGTKSGLDETPTRGDIRIEADESFQPLIETEVFTFTHLYANAKIKAVYKPENDIINDFMRDSVKVIVTSKKLSDYQIQYLRDTQIIARTTTYAYDALAIVTNKENKDTLLKYNTIKDIFLGKTQKWKEVNPKSKLGDIRIIFDNTKSGNVRYFKELFEIKDSLSKNFFAVKNNAEVVDFVSRNPDAFGIISVNWISDTHDSTSERFLKSLKVMEVGTNGTNYYKPYQGYIAEGSYPFCREVFMIGRETFSGLGSGFISFVAGDQGQRIVLKSGLVPATMPIRLIEINKE